MQIDRTTEKRECVRGILLSRGDKVLLMEMAFPWFADNVWIVPGGGLDPDETPEQGLRRELLEETGQSGLSIGPQVWARDFIVRYDGRSIQIEERYFLIEVDHFEPAPRAFEEHETNWFRAFRWWNLSELIASRVPTSPDDLGRLLERFARR